MAAAITSHTATPSQLGTPLVITGAAVTALSTAASLPAPAVVGLTAIATIVGAAAIVDLRERRIPNSHVLAVAAIVSVTAITLSVTQRDPTLVDVATRVGWGTIVSGAPLLFLMWLLRPTTIGGGDWKLLAAIGATLGLADPTSAIIAGWVAVAAQIAASAISRRRVLPFGPALFAGYVVGTVSTIWFHTAPGVTT